MRSKDLLPQFVREALLSGKPREDIRTALTNAGWAPKEIDSALTTWSDDDFLPPVPRPQPYVSARETFFYSLMFGALALSAWYVAYLLHNLLELWLSEHSNQSYINMYIRWSVAMLIVSAPVFLVMNFQSTRTTRKNPGKRRSAVRIWLSYITLFFAAAALLIDLVYVIYEFLNGAINVLFLAKAGVVAIVAGLILIYFQNETKENADAA